MKEYPIYDIMWFIATAAEHFGKDVYRPELGKAFLEVAEVARKHQFDTVSDDGKTE